MMPLESSPTAADYPTEWVVNCFQWAKDMNKRAGYGVIGLTQLLALLNNGDKRDEFIRRWNKERQVASRESASWD
jgi:hypothetical protein